MNKDKYIWVALVMSCALAGTKDSTFKSVMRWIVLLIVLVDMFLYFQ
jgi:hypothetical protein